MEDELTIIVARREELQGHPFTARLVGWDSKGFGYTVEDAITDLFTTSRAIKALKQFER